MKHPPHRFGFLWDDKVSFLHLIVSVTEDALVRNANLAGLEPLADAPFAVLGYATAFLLSKRGEERKHQFAVLRKGMDFFLFKPHLHADGFEMADGFQKVDRISRKTADGLGKYDIDFSLLAVGKHFLKLLPLRCECSRYSVVGVHTCVLPAGILLNQRTVIADLRG